MSNLDMYNRYADPPADAKKEFNNGRFKGTDINPMWRIKVLTEEYGECGFGWYTEVTKMWTEESPGTQEIAVFCEVNLYVKRGGEWSKPIVGVGGNTFVAARKSGLQASDEAYKMAYTDALGIACKALGIGANVWWKAADSKYARSDIGDDKPDSPKASSIICQSCKQPIPAETLLNGKRYSAADIAGMSKKKYGVEMCYHCKRKADLSDSPAGTYDARDVQEVTA